MTIKRTPAAYKRRCLAPIKQQRQVLAARLQTITTLSAESKPLPTAQKVADLSVTTNLSDPVFCETVRHLKTLVVKGDIFRCPLSPFYAALPVSIGCV
ncbi:hypothetical protein ACT691_00275 [Vibrio metschnikovii]